jgi:hypothetical protein
MPGLGLGLGLNRQQQNRFNTAAQQGQGQQFLASRPGIQNRINQAAPGAQQAATNFANTGQVGANAAQRFQPGGGRAPGAGGAPQGSGGTGSQKGGGGGQQAGGMPGQNAGGYGYTPPNQSQANVAQAQSPAQQQAQMNQQMAGTGSWSNVGGQMTWQPYNPAQMGGPMGPMNMNPVPPPGQGPGTWSPQLNTALSAAGQGQQGNIQNATGQGGPNSQGGLGQMFSQLMNQYGAGNMANQTGGASAQSGLQSQNLQSLIQAIMGGLGGQGY